MFNKSFKFSIVFISILFLFSSCDQQKKSSSTDSTPGYNSLISAFTSGLISNQSNIVVRFSSDFPGDIEENSVIEEKIFNISPSVEGKAYWIDKRTLEFRPSEGLPSGTEFKVVLKLSKLMDKKSEDFNFGFNTIPLYA